jgi:hypothetical protein
MTTVEFTIDGDEETVSFDVERILNLGYTGRNEEAVQEHIDELAEEGIESPDEFPVPYPKPNHLIETGGSFEMMSDRTSGEVEFVLLPGADETYVTVGSDHTDRELEQESIPLAKAVCPNFVGERVWRLSDVEDHWDKLELRSWVTDGGDRIRYQEASVDEILEPRALIEIATDRISTPIGGTALFCGSVATETDGFVCGEQFEAELYDPILDRTIRCEYGVEPLSWLAEH